MARLLAGLVASLFALAPAALAVVPVPPDQIAYSGVLAAGGPVDLTARIYDAPSGGTLVFKQSFTGVVLTDGHFTVNLGPSGEPTDAPANPLTTNLRAALAGDLAAGPGRFVELTVNADPPLARVQLVLVPYALRADHALTADVATSSLDTQAVAGLDGGVLTELFEHYNEDGGPPANDPSEGTADVDGDGEMNFVDPDNDGDTLADSEELTLGTAINLVTPRIASLTPDEGSSAAPTPVTVSGTGFVPGLTAAFGSQVFSPASVSSTSFAVTVAPEPAGTVVPVIVTNPNAESDQSTFAFPFVPTAPVPLPFTLAPATKPVSIVARGEELLVYGSQSSSNRYVIDTISDGVVAFDVDLLLGGTGISALGWSPTRVVYGLRGHAGTGQIHLLRDANGDNNLALGEAVALQSPGGVPKTQSPSLAFDAAGRVGGGYVANIGGVQTAMALHDRNGDGVFSGTNELVAIEGVTGATDDLGEAAFDASGRLAYAYYASGGVRLAWDRTGDGDFADTVGGVPELRTIAGSTGCLGLAFDTAGRVAIVSGSSLLYDVTGDADFDDAGETTAVSGACDVTAASQGNRVAIAQIVGSQLRLLVDLTGDGDFGDADEDVQLSNSATQPIAITETASGAVRVLTPQGVLLGPLR